MREWRFAVSLDGKRIGEHRFVLRERNNLRELTARRIFACVSCSSTPTTTSITHTRCGAAIASRDSTRAPTTTARRLVVSGERAERGFRVTSGEAVTGIERAFRLSRTGIRASSMPPSAQPADGRIRSGAGAFAGTRNDRQTHRMRSATASRRFPRKAAADRPLVHARARVARARIAHARGAHFALLEGVAHGAQAARGNPGDGNFHMLGGCKSQRPPLTTAPAVDLARFMGPWYVIGNIPTSIEREAFNPVETYRLDATEPSPPHSSFAGAFDGSAEDLLPTRLRARHALERGVGHAFRVAHQSGLPHRFRERGLRTHHRRPREARLRVDHGAHAAMAEADYEEMLAMVAREGYDVSKVRRVPQQWPESAPRPAGECS